MKPLAQINVIPFIDIMLVLLAVVLTTATFIVEGKIPVTLPSASEAEPISVGEPLELTVDRDGGIYLAQEPVTTEQLANRLTGVDPATAIMLRVDEAAAFGDFIGIVDLLKAHGLERLSIVTQHGGNG
jgi:biopolymer transport protein ExbD